MNPIVAPDYGTRSHADLQVSIFSRSRYPAEMLRHFHREPRQLQTRAPKAADPSERRILAQHETFSVRRKYLRQMKIRVQVNSKALDHDHCLEQQGQV
jgi:hypothetical protein